MLRVLFIMRVTIQSTQNNQQVYIPFKSFYDSPKSTTGSPHIMFSGVEEINSKLILYIRDFKSSKKFEPVPPEVPHAK
jgi:hypothetical protein